VLAAVEPIYEAWPGWKRSTRAARTLEDLPREARAYLARSRKLSEAPVSIVSTGSDRDETIVPADSVVGRWLA